MRKRILFVEQNRDGTIGGSHHSLLLLVQNLDRTRFEPIVAFYEQHSLLGEFRRCAEVVVLPVPVPLQVGRTFASGLVRMLASYARKAVNGARALTASVARLAIVVFRIKPDLIHLNNSVSSAGYEWFTAARLCGAKWITHQRGFSPSVPAAEHLDCVIGISRAVAQDVAKRTPRLAARVVHIYNGIDVDAYVRRAQTRPPEAVRREFDVQPGQMLIGLIGNIQEWKGQDVLLRALPRLSTTTACRCLIVGDTPNDGREFEARLRGIVGTLGLQDRVVFTGYRSDVSAIVSASDVVVHTSVLPEPMGRVVLEGMALGKPVIATDHGGPKEILEHGRTGFLVAPGDPDALATCLNGLLVSPELRRQIGNQAKTHVANSFSAVEYARRVQDVYLSFWPSLRHHEASPVSSISRVHPSANNIRPSA